MTINVYKNCPQYETTTFLFRQVAVQDAKDLLCCYSDKKSVSRMNSDFCTSDFYYTDIAEMEECIKFWLKEQKAERYVRLSIIHKEKNKVIGTVEVMSGEAAVLRIDLANAYENASNIEEILKLAVLKFIKDFKIIGMKIKTSNTPERISSLEKFGFIPSESFRTEYGYYERPVTSFFDQMKGVAFCGLACCVCSENTNCIGCKNEGCPDKDWCKSFSCCKKNNLNGCWECKEYPCDYHMINKPRVKAFAEYISKFGAEQLIAKLQENDKAGLIYHYKDKLVGDYDLAENENEIFEMLN